MTAVITVLAVVIGLFCGALLLLAGIFFWYLLKTMKEVRDTVGAFAKVMEPLIKTGSLQRLTDSAVTLSRIGGEALQAMKAINITVAAFNRAFFKEEAVKELELAASSATPPGEAAPAGQSAGFHYSEEAAASREVAEELRKSGVEVDESRIMVPDQKYGSTV